MERDRYTARIAGSLAIAEDAPYPVLLANIIRSTLEAAIACAADRDEWEHRELRRKGLSALEIARNGKAIWQDRGDFEAELAEAQREGVQAAFEDANELHPGFLELLDADLRERWKRAGYDTPSLVTNMRALFSELEADAHERETHALMGFLGEVVDAIG
jgi:hypothetical protein